MTMLIHHDRISEFRGSWGSGIASVIMESGTIVHVENSPFVRAAEDAFGGVITEGHCVDNDALSGKEIYWYRDSMGMMMAGFILPEQWDEDEIPLGESREVLSLDPDWDDGVSN